MLTLSSSSRVAALTAVLLLTACSTPSPRVTVYDFGPGATAPVATNRMAPLPTVVLTDVEAGSALDGTALLYRLGYADAQQLRPYAQARWSMAPAQLLRQRVRETLGQRRSVLTNNDGNTPGTLTLRLELEEFSHWFASADSSSGLVRVRATLGRSHPARPLAQTSFVVQQPSSSADAAGGARALAQASDTLVQQIDTWLQQAAAAETSAP
jgi:cholesterol transport system auxiliary component